MTEVRSAPGCLPLSESRQCVAVLVRSVAACWILSLWAAGMISCSADASKNSSSPGGGAGSGLSSAHTGGASSGASAPSSGTSVAGAGISTARAGGAGFGGAAAGAGGADAGRADAGRADAGRADAGGADAAGTGSSASTAYAGGAGPGGVAAGTGGRGADDGAVPWSADGSSGATSGEAGLALDDGATPALSRGYDIRVDPYGTSPLVAVVNLRGLDAGKVQNVQVVVSGQDGGKDFVKSYSPTDADLAANLDTSDLTFPEAGYHVPVLGLYADRENDVRIVLDVLDRGRVELGLKITTSLTSQGETAWVPSIQVKTAVLERMEPGWTVAEISIEPNPNPVIVFVDWTRSIAFDERGAIRWALRLDLPKGETFTLRRSTTGTLLTGSYDTVVEVTKLGRILHRFQLPGYTLNHEIIQIGSTDNGEGVPGGQASEHFGNILVLASQIGASTIQDHIVELDSVTGQILNAWDMGEIFDRTRRTYINAERWDISQNGDWFHDNGLAYSKTDESIIVSGRHQGVAKIRRDGTLAWLLAPHKGWNQPQASKLLTAVSATQSPYADSVQLGNQAAGTASSPEFDWPFGQHSPVLLPNGDLLLFDNGASRHFSGFCGSFSRAVIYRIDEAAMTVRQVGQFIFTKSESSCYESNTHRLLQTGNIFIQPACNGSNTAIAKEVTAQAAEDGTLGFDQVVFDATVNMNVIDTTRWYVYSFRGHRWAF